MHIAPQIRVPTHDDNDHYLPKYIDRSPRSVHAPFQEPQNPINKFCCFRCRYICDWELEQGGGCVCKSFKFDFLLKGAFFSRNLKVQGSLRILQAKKNFELWVSFIFMSLFNFFLSLFISFIPRYFLRGCFFAFILCSDNNKVRGKEKKLVAGILTLY